jgi:hypothetical protein
LKLFLDCDSFSTTAGDAVQPVETCAGTLEAVKIRDTEALNDKIVLLIKSIS